MRQIILKSIHKYISYGPDKSRLTYARTHTYTRGGVNKFVELCIFVYNSKFLLSYLCRRNLCQSNDNSHGINPYLFCFYFLLENLYPQAKMESQKRLCSSLRIIPKSCSKQVGRQVGIDNHHLGPGLN